MAYRIATLLVLVCLARSVSGENAISVSGRRVTITEFSAWLDLPLHWSAATVPPNHESGFEAEDLKALRSSTREWDQQYREVFNSFLPFETLVFQAGEKRWKEHATVLEPFMRIYVTDFSAKEIWTRLNDAGAKAIEHATRGRTPHPSYTLEPFRRYDWEKKVMWDFSHISYAFELWFGDYGGRTRVDLYVKDFGKRTVVLAFFPIAAGDVVYGRRHEADYQYILDHVGGSFLNKL